MNFQMMSMIWKDIWVNADKKALESDENTNELSYSILKQDDPQESW